MTGTPTPLPAAEAPAPSYHESEPRRPWWRHRWVLVVAALAFVVGGLAIYVATRPSESDRIDKLQDVGLDQVVEELQDEGLSESDADQYVSSAQQYLSQYLDQEPVVNPNDGNLSDDELGMVRAFYMAFRDTEVGQLAGVLDESVFTDVQIRTYSDEACAIAQDSASSFEWQIRLQKAFADDPTGAGNLGGLAAAVVCESAMRDIGMLP